MSDREDEEMLARSIDPVDVGETPDRGTPPPARRRSGSLGGLGRGRRRQAEVEKVEANAEFRARVRKLAESLPEPKDDPDPQGRVEIFRATWLTSLTLGGAGDLADWTLDKLESDQHPAALRAFADALGQPDQAVRNLVLGGRVGPGKTSAAIAVGNAAVARGVSARFIKHSTYLKWLRPEGSPKDLEPWQIRKRFRDCTLLVLDDLAASLTVGEPATEFVRTETLDLIGDRTDTPGHSTIVTTNHRSETLTVMFGEAMMSRLSKNGHVLVFIGPDRRGRLSW